jgi:CubicO group peptidase (beta-lactamase class C family)
VVLFALLLAAAALTLTRTCGPPSLSRGVWLTHAPEQYALVFEHTGGLVSGTMHHLRDGKQVLQWGFAGTRTRGGELELRWGNDNSLTATVDLGLGELRGRLRLADGTAYEALFRHTTAAEVQGLAALPELPYRLRPPAPGSGWEVAEPGAVGIDPRRMAATVRAVTRGEAGLLHSLVMIRRGKLVVEEYFHGYGRQDLHELQSSTKSVASLLVGIARDRGDIASVEAPVLAFFPERAATAGAGWQEVTLEHLLTMTAGLDWDPREVFREQGIGPALFAKVFGRRVVHEPGSRWLYNGLDVELLAGVLHRATGLQADELAARHLFAPLGITEWDWELGKTEGYPSLAGTLHLRPLDMAKIGQLVLDGGRWRGEPLISEAWIEESTAPLVATGRQSQKYGYLWWRLPAPLDAGSHPVLVASGWGSQFIHVVPALEAVIVTTGGNQLNGRNYDVGKVLLRHLVPGVER